MKGTDKDLIVRGNEFIELTEQSAEESTEAWIAYIKSVWSNSDPELQSLLLANREYRDHEHIKKGGEAWKTVFRNN